MHIRTITISGFKSYRDQTAIEPFSPRHNVVVGRNGSGKSNFFAAIRFVLSDDYGSMSRDERQRLLHEGTSTTTTLSAYVEIVFDNTDGRFPTSLPELRLRRTIGQKKDEYSLDRKSVTKAEVMNLLESAGFSRSNPYYIVPQGRITRLTNMSDQERLNLLKDVAGTKVYEQKRAESTRIMEETDAKREQIADLLTTIETRLNELETEKEELKEYQDKDRDRRCIEYALYQRELEEVTSALEQIEEDRRNDVHTSNEQRKDFMQREAKVQQLEDELTKAKHALSTVSIALRQYEGEMADLVRERTEIECLIADFQQAGVGGEKRRQQLAEELESLETRVSEATERLVELGADLEDKVAAEREARETLEETQAQLQVLYAKQGRSRRFKSKRERDQFLNNEIQQLQAYETQQQQTVADLGADVEGAKAQLAEATHVVEQQNVDEEERRNQLRQMAEEVNKLRVDLDGMQEQRKELWREDGKLAQSVSNAKGEMDTAERTLQGMMDKDTSIGLRSVRAIAKELDLDGVHGPLYELFEVSDRYKTAVEVTAGNSLFHVVVVNDDTVTKVLDVMNKSKKYGGRVTFMPLNRLKSINVQYPQANDAISMISKLKFDRAYIMAMEQVFARTIICEDLPTAAQYTRTHGLNAVTVEGDRVDRKGSMTGGYHDVRRSRLDAIRQLRKWREAYKADFARHTEVKQGLARLEQQISTTMGNIQRLESRRRAMQEDRAIQARQANLNAREEEQARQRLSRLEAALQEAEAELKAATTKRTALQQELTTPMAQQLSAQEQQRLEQLTNDAEEQKQALLEASQERQHASTERSELDIELTENLRRRREEIRGQLDDLEGDAGAGVLQAGDIELRRTELGNIVRAIEELSGQINTSEEEVDRLLNEISDKTIKLEQLQNEQLESTRAIVRVQKNVERYLTKRQTLVNRRDECSNAIRDLGVLPEEAFSKYTSQKPDKLVKRLHKINDGLKKFAHVNKKAFEQYYNFTKQRDDLLVRRGELEESADSIQDLITTLDQRKDEAIERTFKQVSSYFEEVFEQLVPAGKGVLVMQKKIDMYQDEESEVSEQAPQKSEIDNYTGVSIKVSFNSKQDEGQRISQLSGGQKSLVALATVFAIQKCDPAPFYLFDEIDANLDAQYRSAVADMIHSLSSSAQFITTTFRGEMLAHADQCYGVYFDKRKVSSIALITRDDAQAFLENAAA
ncbi:Structural maintenance of chromosomes protein 3 [Cryptotrichosporon argae]